MKKILLWVLILLIVFLALVYASVWIGNNKKSTAKIYNLQEMENADFSKHDSVLIAASTFYGGNFLKETMQGENYREAWSTPVKVPIVFLDTLLGGMKIIEEGGGSQTHSLKIKSSSGVMYSLRSINKFPDSHIPEFAKTLGLQNIVLDGISAQHPYGAVVASSLAESAGVLHTYPRPMFIPNQQLLGDLNEKYGNQLYLLEFETEGDVNWTPYKNVTKIIETDDLQELKAKEGSQVKIDKRALVRARLFDLLIGDWDRHSKQWGWVLQKTSSGYHAIPLPGDRDNAFFKLDGVIPTIVSNQYVQPLVRPFESKIDHLPGLVYPFDVYFLRNIPAEIFIEEAKSLQQQLTDEEIEQAFKVWPDEIYKLNGKEIVAKIKQRRDDLPVYAKEFRSIIQERELLQKPLKGSEDLKLNPDLLKCFDCIK